MNNVRLSIPGAEARLAKRDDGRRRSRFDFEPRGALLVFKLMNAANRAGCPCLTKIRELVRPIDLPLCFVLGALRSRRRRIERARATGRTAQ
jgi:hypothetical protein